MAEDRENWKSIDEVGPHVVPWFSVVYTEVSEGNPARARVMLRTMNGPIELFRAPIQAVLEYRSPGAVPGDELLALATLPERWFQGMENAVAKYHALRALKEPI